MPRPNQYAQANLIISGTLGRQFEVVCWLIGPAAVPTIDQTYVDTFADDIGSHFVPAIKDVLTADCTFEGVKLRVVDHGVSYTSVSVASGGPGLQVSDFQPPQVAVVIQKHSNAPGRPGLGRWFIPLVPEVYTTKYLVNAGGIAKYDTLGLQLITGVITAGQFWAMGHYSRKNDTLLPIASHRLNHRLKRQGRRALQDLFA